MMHNLRRNSTYFQGSFGFTGIKHLIHMGWVFLLFLSPGNLSAQETEEFDELDSLMAEYALLDSLLLQEIGSDSSELFSLIEDLINEDYLKSQFTIRAGYTSNITNAGRNFGVSQYGLNAGVAFYHKSGLYADVAGFYNSDQEPKYNTTILALGYMGLIGKNWNYFVSYDRFIYNQSKQEDLIVEYPLTNSVNASINYNFKGFVLGTDYSFMFGDELSHRLRLNLGYSYYTKKVWIFDNIGFNPNVSMLAGNQNITSIVFNQEIALENSRDLIRQIGRRRYLDLYENNRNLLIFLLSEEQTNNVFGIMNYSVFVPITFRVKNTTLMLNYSLNFPVALPGEEGLDTTPNNYVSATLLYSIPLK
jgi:hypothetical protein